ncbi:MAG: hypothetical protein ABI460_15760 [Caldimonas sp.]
MRGANEVPLPTTAGTAENKAIFSISCPHDRSQGAVHRRRWLGDRHHCGAGKFFGTLIRHQSAGAASPRPKRAHVITVVLAPERGRLMACARSALVLRALLVPAAPRAICLAAIAAAADMERPGAQAAATLAKAIVFERWTHGA